MPTKQIGNATQAWSGGATWNVLLDNQLTQTVSHLTNASGGPLFIGDCVGLDATASATTGVTAVLPTSAGTGFGVVGGEIFSNVSPAAGGGAVTLESGPARTDTATVTNASATVTDAAVRASDLFRAVSGPGIPSGAFIISVTAGTSFVMSAAATATGTAVTISDPPPTIGPGWSSTAQYGIPPGTEVPVVLMGFAWVNVGTLTAPASGALFTTGAGLPNALVVAPASATAAQIGQFFGRALGGPLNTALNTALGVTNRNLAAGYMGLGG